MRKGFNEMLTHTICYRSKNYEDESAVVVNCFHFLLSLTSETTSLRSLRFLSPL